MASRLAQSGVALVDARASSGCPDSGPSAERDAAETAAGAAAGAWKLAAAGSGDSGSEAGEGGEASEGGEVQVGAAVGAAAGWLVGPAGTMLRASSACP